MNYLHLLYTGMLFLISGNSGGVKSLIFWYNHGFGGEISEFGAISGVVRGPTRWERPNLVPAGPIFGRIDQIWTKMGGGG